MISISNNKIIFTEETPTMLKKNEGNRIYFIHRDRDSEN